MAKLGNEVGAWEQATQAFDTAYRKVTTVGQTQTVETLDKERDSLYSGLIGTVNNATKSPIAAQKAAATALLEPIKRYDVKTSGEYQQQTMRVEQFCQDLLASYASQLTTLGLTAWVEALQAKNTEFQEAMRARTDEQADYVKGELTQLRQQIIVSYRAFRKLANVVFIYEGDTAYATTIDQMNAEVRHYKQIIARKGGPGATSSEASPNPSQGTASPDPSQGGENGGGDNQGGGTGTIDVTGGGGSSPTPDGGGTASPDPSQGGGTGGTNTGGGSDNPENDGGD